MHPILLSLGPLVLRSYGALIFVGCAFMAAFWFWKREAMGIATVDDVWVLINVYLLSGYLGGRIFYLVEYVPLFSPRFWSEAFSFTSGFSVMGGFISVTAGLVWFCRSRRISLLRLSDYIGVSAPAAHFFGRLGCFAAGCCYGLPVKRPLPWAVTFRDPRALVPPEWLGVPLHPAQLYEAVGVLAIAALLYRFALPAAEAGRIPRGSVCAAYLAAYSLLRFGLEYLRGDTVPLRFLGLTAGQGMCLGLLASAALMFAIARRQACIRS